MRSFLIINISSLKLIPVTMIVYCIQYGGVNPNLIVAFIILATPFSTRTGIVYCE